MQKQEMLPSTKDAYNESIKEYGELLETVVIEDIFMPLILNLLRLNSEDFHLINVLSVTVLEKLGDDKAILEIAKQYMGPVTIKMQKEADFAIGRQV